MCPSGSRPSPIGQTTIERCSNLLRDASLPNTVVQGPSIMVAHTPIMHTFEHFLRSTEYTIASPHHTTQENGQVEVSNREVKNILKKIFRPNGKDWVHKLPNTLWAYQIAYKTPIGMSPFQIIYEKAFHLPVELEHRAY